MKNSFDHYRETEIPYKLNMLYAYLFWCQHAPNNYYGDDFGLNITRCSTLETSIIFGRHILQFFGITINSKGDPIEHHGRKDDFTIRSFKDKDRTIKTSNPILLENLEAISYLLNLANKRVAHDTLTSHTIGKVDKDKIGDAISAIHKLVEQSIVLDHYSLLMYNPDTPITT